MLGVSNTRIGGIEAVALRKMRKRLVDLSKNTIREDVDKAAVKMFRERG